MAKATKRCDWCKKRRVREEVQVIMRGPGDMAPSGAIIYPVTFAREWKLCSQCRTECTANLTWAFQARPE